MRAMAQDQIAATRTAGLSASLVCVTLLPRRTPDHYARRWGGFKRPVEQRRNELYFRIRLWGRIEILDALFEAYDRLPEAFRAELPLRRTWMLVPEDEEGGA